jgi:membrane fusion protein, multidrug efflux system
MRWSACAAVILIASYATAWAQSPAPARAGTVLAEQRPLERSIEFVGRVEAVERVDIRARVTGYLSAVLFKEGDIVKDGGRCR